MQHVKAATLVTGSLSADMRDTVCSNSCKVRQRSRATMLTRGGKHDIAGAARSHCTSLQCCTEDFALELFLQVSRNAQTNVVAAGLAARQVMRDSHGSVQASVQGREKEKRPQIVDLRAFP
ncbi:hypothetical protein [Xanthomonas sp. LMG 12461]|uniref:hypothetical protein n=1 Tax=Xanthomonas sp. LMG 12461 TaxID=2014543 RepID=UPI00186AE2A2|nr:hypothetical protein [Xanthomonas sp. LMG 12461]